MVEFLLTQDPGRARVIESQIEATNSKRRFESRQVEKAAEQMLQSSPDDRHAPAIVLHHPAWPGGIVGIVAGHLVEKYQKPAILLTGTDPIHGSARSVTGINIHQVISEHADLFSNFGGHPMAAGLSMPAENYSSFKHKFLKSVEEAAKFVEAIPVLDIDQELRLDEITMDLVEEIERLSPFGAGFPPLKFLIRDLQLVSHHTVGQNGEHRQAVVEDEQGNQQRIIWWNGGDSTLPEAQFDLVCTLSKSDYRGTLQINAEWVDSRLSEKGKVDLAQRQFEIIDHRHTPNPMQILRDEINKAPKSLVWAEAVNLDEIEGVTRTDLHPTKNLILLTSPPSQAVLQEALQQTKPNKVIVFGIDPVIKDTDAFLKRVAGLAKFTVNHKQGRAAIDRLAGACAAQREAVLIGLKVWEARGQLTVNFVEEELIIELTQSEPNFAAEAEYLAILTGLLEESMAYRRFFQNSDLKSILR
jgi:single-stranded-DNA-specific exonuclease